MYVLKIDELYFVGNRGDMAGCADSSTAIGLSYSQKDAKRFNIALTPLSSVPAYIKMLFGESARFVKLRAKRDTFGPFADRFDDNEWP